MARHVDQSQLVSPDCRLKIAFDRVVQGNQWYWDYRVPDVADYVVSSILHSVSDPAVDGTFVDDIGFGGEHPEMLVESKLSKRDVAAINNASLRTYARLKTALIKAGKYDWQSLGIGDFAGPGITRNPSAEPNPLRKTWDKNCT